MSVNVLEPFRHIDNKRFKSIASFYPIREGMEGVCMNSISFWNPIRRDYAVSDLAFIIAIATLPFFSQAPPNKPDRHGKPARRGTSRGLEARAGLEHE